MSENKTEFKVHTYAIQDDDDIHFQMYIHWSKGLKMIIIKDGVKIELDSKEIEAIVKSLPRTVSGRYY